MVQILQGHEPVIREPHAEAFELLPRFQVAASTYKAIGRADVAADVAGQATSTVNAMRDELAVQISLVDLVRIQELVGDRRGVERSLERIEVPVLRLSAAAHSALGAARAAQADEASRLRLVAESLLPEADQQRRRAGDDSAIAAQFYGAVVDLIAVEAWLDDPLVAIERADRLPCTHQLSALIEIARAVHARRPRELNPILERASATATRCGKQQQLVNETSRLRAIRAYGRLLGEVQQQARARALWEELGRPEERVHLGLGVAAGLRQYTRAKP